MIKNKIGLEAEFFVANESDELVMPGDYGLPTDDLKMLAECRGLPGESVEEAISLFQKEFVRMKRLAGQARLQVITKEGWVDTDLKFYAKVLKASARGKLEALDQKGDVENIYGEENATLSDQVVEDGIVKAVRVSCGLHIHFSSDEVDEKAVYEEQFEVVNLPLSIAGQVEASLRLFRSKGYKSDRKVVARASRITNPVIKHIVSEMDTKVHPRFPAQVPLRHRRPGLFRRKPYGFEYRSLPFNAAASEQLVEITSSAFDLLNSL